MIVTHQRIAYMTIIRVFGRRSVTEIWSAVDGTRRTTAMLVFFTSRPAATHLSPKRIRAGTALERADVEVEARGVAAPTPTQYITFGQVNM
jgi:hypothetical protein